MPLIGALVVWRDGIGRIRDMGGVVNTFLRGVGQGHTSLLALPVGTANGTGNGRMGSMSHNRLPIQDQFLVKILPVALDAQRDIATAAAMSGAGTAAGRSGEAEGHQRWLAEARFAASKHTLFGRFWNTMVQSLREQDLVSDYEQSLLQYGRGTLQGPVQMPLFLYGGPIRSLLANPSPLILAAQSSATDAELAAQLERSNPMLLQALLEIHAALPEAMFIAARSHRGLASESDELLWEAIQASMRPVGTDWRRIVLAVLGGGGPLAQVEELHNWMMRLLRTYIDPQADVTNGATPSPLYTAVSNVLLSMYTLCSPQAAKLAGFGATFSEPGQAAGMARVQGDGTPGTPQWLARILSGPNTGAAPTLLQQLDNFALGQSYLNSADHAHRAYMLLWVAPSRAGISLGVEEAERRIAFWVNSLYMRRMPSSPSAIEMPTFCAVTPQYSEPVIYARDTFLEAVNQQGVSPLMYLKALHPLEWRNFCERLGLVDASTGALLPQADDEVWTASSDAAGSRISGELETRLWASYRGQTLARTIAGVMQHCRAMRMLYASEMEMRAIHAEVRTKILGTSAAAPAPRAPGSTVTVQVPPPGAAGAADSAVSVRSPGPRGGEPSPSRGVAGGAGGQLQLAGRIGVVGQPLVPMAGIAASAAVLGDWLATKKTGYVCCCQMYSAPGREFERNRKDIDFLLARHPLLSVVYWDLAPLRHGLRNPDGSVPQQLFSICVNGTQGVRYRIPVPGNPVKDNIGEGKPSNTDNAMPYFRGLLVQNLDMNQDA
jgi:hypothetical protein